MFATNSAHLCYVYIHEYKCNRDIELNIDSRYSSHFDKDTGTLSIKNIDNFPENFWGRGIHSVAAIVGDNGVGKSTALEFILTAIVDGANANEVNGILVYEKGEELYVYGKDVKSISGNAKRLKKPEKLLCLYYNGQFQPYESMHNLRNAELAGSYNISDSYLLIKDVQNYSNTEGHFLNQSIYSHLAQFKAKNNFRICLMLANKHLYEKIAHFFKLKYILFCENQSGIYALKYGIQRSYSGLTKPEPRLTHHDIKQRALAGHIYNNFLNLSCNIGVADERFLNALTIWQKSMVDDKPVLSQFKDYIQCLVSEQDIKSALLKVYCALEKLDNLAEFKDNIQNGYYYLDVAKDYEKIMDLCNILEKSGYLVAQFFDMVYAQSLTSDTILSSGENNLLNLFSRLYFAIQKDTEKFANLNSPALLILDEAEIAFHPEWQRRYLQLIISFLQEMMVRPGLKFQILISTHSPILLSDIPECCVNFLHKGNDGVVRNLHFPEYGSFAANVFEQYRTSFFMKDGLVGAFAAEKIKSLLEKIHNGEIDKEIVKTVMLVGDERIRNYLLSEMSKNNNDYLESFYQSQLNE